MYVLGIKYFIDEKRDERENFSIFQMLNDVCGKLKYVCLEY